MAPYAPEISHPVWTNNVTSGQALHSAEHLKAPLVYPKAFQPISKPLLLVRVVGT